MFKLNVGISAFLALLLLVGIGGAVSGGLMGNTVWALVFGGMSAADVLGVVAYRPLTQINNAILSAQRLDLLFLGTRERLHDCARQLDIERQIACATAVWKEMNAELAALGRTN